MSKATDLIAHIQALIAADSSLASKLGANSFYFGVPQTVPSVYLDGLYLVDDKLDTWRFNISYLTTDMSLSGLEVAQQLKTALQQSNCIAAEAIAVRPEPDAKRTRYLITCSSFMYKL